MTIARTHAVDARRHVDQYFDSPGDATEDAHLLREATAEALVSIAYSLATIAERMPPRETFVDRGSNQHGSNT